MKILLYGDCHILGSGGWCYAESLREMGHQVTTFRNDDGLELYGKALVVRAYRKIVGHIMEFHRQRHVRRLLAMVVQVRPEIIVILKGLYLGPEDVLALRRSGAWVVAIHHDDLFSRNPNNRSDLQRKALSAYNYLLVANENNVSELLAVNPCVEFFPFAYYPRIHRPVPIPSSEISLWSIDVVFVGSWAPDRCRLLAELARRVHTRYAVWGNQWEKGPRRSAIAPFVRRRAVMMDDMAKAIGGAKVALGFLRKENRDDYTQRTFEIPACGGVLLAERTKRHCQIFREGVEAEFFDPANPDELIAKVERLLKDDNHRENLRAAGHAALLRQRHTYRDRLERLLELYDLHHE